MSSTLSKKYLFFFVYTYAQGARAANVCSFEEDKKKEDAPAPSTFTLLFYCLQLRQYHHNS